MTETENGTTFVIQDASAESILAERALEETLKQPGDLCPYAVLREALGKDPRQKPAYGYVMTARRRFERRHGCVLDTIPKEGIKWRTGEEVIMSVAARDLGHIRRSTSSAMRRQRTTLVSDKDLKPETMKRRNENIAKLGVLSHFTKAKTQQQIAEVADKSGRVLSAGDVLKHFQKGSS